MDNKLLHILQSQEVPIENQQLIDFLKGNLDNITQQQLEASELDDPMMQDALEGLQAVNDTSRLEKMAREMNQTLQKKLATQKSKHSETRRWKDQHWLLIAIATVLLIVMICYLVFRAYRF